MSFCISKFEKATPETSIKMLGEDVKLTYHLGVTTAPWIDELQNALSGNAATDALLEKACELIESWDITDEKGKELPITVENMKLIPMSFIGRMVRACMNDAALGASDEEKAA
jgi:hypothetical protein